MVQSLPTPPQKLDDKGFVQKWQHTQAYVTQTYIIANTTKKILLTNFSRTKEVETFGLGWGDTTLKTHRCNDKNSWRGGEPWEKKVWGGCRPRLPLFTPIGRCPPIFGDGEAGRCVEAAVRRTRTCCTVRTCSAGWPRGCWPRCCPGMERAEIDVFGYLSHEQRFGQFFWGGRFALSMNLAKRANRRIKRRICMVDIFVHRRAKSSGSINWPPSESFARDVVGGKVCQSPHGFRVVFLFVLNLAGSFF